MNKNPDLFTGPPRDAYSRVTNPERFAALHDAAEKMLRQLEVSFDVERAEGFGLDPELEKRYELAQPSVKLVPRDTAAAPLVVAFSRFPGLHVRLGRWCMLAFPSCGCDACNETAETEIDRLTTIIEDVTAGRFREAVHLSTHEDAHQEWEFWRSGGHFSRQSFRLDSDRARQLTAGSSQLVHDWKPWPKRT